MKLRNRVQMSQLTTLRPASIVPVMSEVEHGFSLKFRRHENEQPEMNAETG
jgi:hypothetical protein